MIFATQFVFYLMVLFVRAANKGKVTHGKTPAYFIYLVHFCTIVALVGVMRKISNGFLFTLLFTLYINYSCMLKDSFQNTHTKGTNKKNKWVNQLVIQ